jgi:hypothetical protein
MTYYIADLAGRHRLCLEIYDRRNATVAAVIWVTGKKMGVNFIAQDQILEKLTERY